MHAWTEKKQNRKKATERERESAEKPSKEDGLDCIRKNISPDQDYLLSLLFCRSHRLSILEIILCLSDGFKHYYIFLFKNFTFFLLNVIFALRIFFFFFAFHYQNNSCYFIFKRLRKKYKSFF